MKISNETKIGALTIISVALLIIGFNILKGNSVFSRSKVIYAQYNDVQGLSSSSPVQVNGLDIGHVSSLTLAKNHSGQVWVKMTINKNINIPVNSIASIISPDLLGSKIIQISFGNATTYLVDGDTIKTAPPASITGDLMKQVQPLTQQLQGTLAYLDTVLLDIHSMINDNTKNSISGSIKNLNVMLTNLANASSHVNDIMQNLLSVTGNLKNDNDTINQILGNVKTISSGIANADLNGTLQNFRKSINELNDVLNKINSGNGSLSMLINNKQLYNNLEASTANLNRLLEDLRLNPQRYVHFSIFGKKNKVQPLPDDSTGTH